MIKILELEFVAKTMFNSSFPKALLMFCSLVFYLFVPCIYLTTFASQLSTSQCPKDVETLAELLLDDIPDYTNRARQRAIRTSNNTFSYVIVAGEPEFEPLPLNIMESVQTDELVKQLFFTTLERRYTGQQVFEVQNYHWLFLTQTDSGWRMVTIFSRFGSSKPNVPPTPPKETSNGTMGQAIRFWLRDCRARQTSLENSEGNSNT